MVGLEVRVAESEVIASAPVKERNAMKPEQFKGELLGGHTGAAVEVPFDPAARWAISATPLWRCRHGYHVQGVLNGVRFKSVVVPRARKFFVLVDESLQEAAKVSAGDTIEITLMPLVEEPADR